MRSHFSCSITASYRACSHKFCSCGRDALPAHVAAFAVLSAQTCCRASLAIDSDASQLAAQTLHTYLQTAVVTSKCGSQLDSGHPPDAVGHITSELYMMAARMYTVEVLLQTAHHSVCKWQSQKAD